MSHLQSTVDSKSMKNCAKVDTSLAWGRTSSVPIDSLLNLCHLLPHHYFNP